MNLLEEKCCECGEPAIKTEDFAVFDYRKSYGTFDLTPTTTYVKFCGITRISLCRKCIDERHRFTEKSKLPGFNKQKALDKEIAEYNKLAENNFEGASLRKIVFGIVKINNQKTIVNAEKVISAIEDGINPFSNEIMNVAGIDDDISPYNHETGAMRTYVSMVNYQDNVRGHFEPISPPVWIEPLYNLFVGK